MPDNIDILHSKVLDRYIEIQSWCKLCSLRFVPPGKKPQEKKTYDITFELERYFEGEIIDFSFDVDISYLSPFEQKVLTQTRKIKYGKTITYSELAEKIGSRAYRAVGNALSKNPVPIIIPCHRVVAKKGIGGYSQGLEIKTRLLELEKRNLNNL
ncbi:MAG: methylated-DNA--[protein]-cysteine S-methyltransferase [Candidatus Methanoperedens sp.]|nr:methylated-DNA--[protein]-cysteine S-methyltransferase [Candidatus Methanoperedens sp.]